jgi:hypothetical protein
MILTIAKSIQFSFLSGIQISDPLLMEIDFFLAIRCNQEFAGQISCKSKLPRFFSEFSSISMHRKFHEFSFKFHFESREDSIRKVVPYLNLFPSIFYLEFFKQEKVPFRSVKV